MAATPITASMLYDLVACPHRVSMDLFADPGERDAVSPFVQLLWDRGAAHETEVIANLGEPFTDLSICAASDKERLTLEAMDRGDCLIYGGRISVGELLGEPDLLRKAGSGYIAGDIKSGAGEEGGDDNADGKPKTHYAVQLGLYTDILEQMGRSPGRRGFVWDIHGKEVTYDFSIAYGAKGQRTLWMDYQDCLAEARGIVNRTRETSPAYSSGICKNCVWYSACIAKLESTNDLTLIPELGRSKRDAMIGYARSIKEFAATDPATFLSGKKTVFSGIGPPTLEKLHNRAKLISKKGATPYLRTPVELPTLNRELFFDIEVDPMRNFCYLHGFVERIDNDIAKERFIFFFADDVTDEAEGRAFAEAWQFMQSSLPCVIYYYSKYERSIYRKLRQKYPHVCTETELEALFNPEYAIDLYFDVVLKATEWPTRDYSIKTLAKYLGFVWHDPHPSGAASIEWFDRWVRSRNSSIRRRIVEYNEDDCRATRVLLDGIRGLSLGP